MKTEKKQEALKIKLFSAKKQEKGFGFSAELRKLIALKQRMPLQFVG